jgi:hypothetical protein
MTLTHRPMTAAQFSALSPYGKGYAVYMLGDREDEPNVPKEWTPREDEAEEYKEGQMQAVLDVQDGEE